ncbi:hypothetical protein Ahia01_001201700, partial [Argonauta hians]
TRLLRISHHTVDACYGVYNNELRLHCSNSKLIKNVTRMIHAVKAKSRACPSETSEANFVKGCCTLDNGDCEIPNTNQNMFVNCIGRSSCILLSTRIPVGDFCDQDVFPAFTSFVSVEYECELRSGEGSISTKRKPVWTSLKTTTEAAKPEHISNHSHIDEISMKSSSEKVTSTTVRTSVGTTTGKATIKTFKKENEEPAIFLGTIIAITCGVIGMLLSVLCLWIYCRRKNQNTPEPDIYKAPSKSFWNNILPPSLTPKSLGKGYNNFTSYPSAARSNKDGQHSQILRTCSDSSRSDQSVASSSIGKKKNINSTSSNSTTTSTTSCTPSTSSSSSSSYRSPPSPSNSNTNTNTNSNTNNNTTQHPPREFTFTVVNNISA